MSRVALLRQYERVLCEGRVLAYIPEILPGRRFAKASLGSTTGSTSVPESWMTLAYLQSPVLDQDSKGGTGSCTGHALTSAIEIAHNSANDPLPFHLSPDFLYKNGRAMGRLRSPDGSFPPLTDDGAMCSLVLRGAETFGVKRTRAVGPELSDVDPSTVNDEPDLSDLEEGAIKIPRGDYVIPDCAWGVPFSDVSLELKRTLSATSFQGQHVQGLPVTFGVWVDKAFMNWNGVTALGPSSTDSGGGHAMVLIGYQTVGNGKTLWLIRTSWGRFGVPAGNLPYGCIWVNDDFIASCTDLFAIAPTFQ